MKNFSVLFPSVWVFTLGAIQSFGKFCMNNEGEVIEKSGGEFQWGSGVCQRKLSADSLWFETNLWLKLPLANSTFLYSLVSSSHPAIIRFHLFHS
jgi:hypothetical protein